MLGFVVIFAYAFMLAEACVRFWIREVAPELRRMESDTENPGRILILVTSIFVIWCGGWIFGNWLADALWRD